MVERHFVDNIFVLAACTAGKGRQGRFILVDKIFVHGQSSNHENQLFPGNYQLKYTVPL